MLLIQRGQHPFKGAWALPGGFVGIIQKAAGKRITRSKPAQVFRSKRAQQVRT